MYVVRRNLLFENDMLFPDIRIHEDFAFVPALVLSARHVAVMDYVGYVYVKRHNSLSKAQSLDGIKREIAAFFRAYDIVIDRIRKLDVSDTIKGMVIQDCFHRLEKRFRNRIRRYYRALPPYWRKKGKNYRVGYTDHFKFTQISFRQMEEIV